MFKSNKFNDIICLIWGRNLFDLNTFLFRSDTLFELKKFYPIDRQLKTIEFRIKWALAWSDWIIRSGENLEKPGNLAFVKQINISVNC